MRNFRLRSMYYPFTIAIFLNLLVCGCKSDEESFIQNDLSSQDKYENKPVVIEDTARFNFLKELFGSVSTLNVISEEVNPVSGRVTINGYDSQEPNTPFTFIWGDGKTSEGFFPQSYKYNNAQKNYVVKVVANYEYKPSDTAEAFIRFLPKDINPVSIPSEILVTIPDYNISLTSRFGYAPDDLTYFDDSYFYYISRSDLEYILSVAGWIQYEFVNYNVYQTEGKFNQVLLRNPDQEFGGMGSLWFTDPPGIACDDFGQPGAVEYGALFHEMGHGFTLNTPADYWFGDNIDGDINIMYGEGMAVIFSLGAAWELLNNYEYYGLCEGIVNEIYYKIKNDYRFLREVFGDYIQCNRCFDYWSYSHHDHDNKLNAFLIIAYKFCSHAAEKGIGYKVPIQRMMKLLQVFNEELKIQYNLDGNTAETDENVATFLIAAMSYAFEEDLRDEFRNLNFPINDNFYYEFLEMVD